MSSMEDKECILAPVDQIVLVDQINRARLGPFQSRSLPGHLLHFVESGKVRQWAGGKSQLLGAGSLVWYHEDEPVTGEILKAPWRFITINFYAPSILPPPDDQRVRQTSGSTFLLARKLLNLWKEKTQPSLERQLRCYQLMLSLLSAVLPVQKGKPFPRTNGSVWWQIEKLLREHLETEVSLESMQAMSGFSQRTLHRLCLSATGMAPMKRVKELRLCYSRGLIQHSKLPISRIAYQVGYNRSQEFSRDYHKRFGVTPTEDRRQPPNYLELERVR